MPEPYLLLKLLTRYSQTIRHQDHSEALGKGPNVAVSRSNATFKTMEFNMAGKVILRASLVLALVITAHLIKPFSIKNVTHHLLFSTRSFRFALPTQLRDKFDHANYLAINLSNSLFEADEGIRDFTRGMAADLAFRPIDVQTLDEVNKSATKHKQNPKKSAPAKRINRTGKRSFIDPPILSNLVAFAHSNEIRLVELSPARLIEAPRVTLTPLCPTKLLPARITATGPIGLIEAAITPRKRDCEKREVDQKTRITWIEDETGAKSGFWVVEMPLMRKVHIRVSEPEDQKVEAPAKEVEAEIMGTEPVPPPMADEPKASLPSSPFAKCLKDQPWHR